MLHFKPGNLIRVPGQVHIGPDALGVTPEVGVVTGRADVVATGHPLSEPCTAA